MPISEVTARRYAVALMDVSAEKGVSDKCLKDMESFQKAVDGSADLKGAFCDPTIPTSAAAIVVQRIGMRLDLDKTSVSFLSILASRRRLDGLARIISEYCRERDSRSGQATGEVISAAPVSDAQLERLSTAIGRKIGKRVTLTRRIDPGLLSGLQVVVGDRVYDLSARTYLDSLKNRLLHNR